MSDLANFTLRSGDGSAGGGTGDFTAGGPQIAWNVSGGDMIVSMDIDGNNTVDHEIELTGVSTLQHTDFIL